ncbi:MAG: TolC family protein [Candidatus Aminicenantes bacterium]|nr:TolC family protein [Candidatus Aminicenantes bacterium]NIM83414.1 TolC family protein [Candidatus Aminicenantes bacterium]NIN24685.1 TolC family protein [Candidatus Aminicenantes bacterium]NIN48446.1 TolC family protein [Candidatus Aminicenantes bacterium]NIN91343.1 TolC family protein [Candidatus Aminicenantes bacterium]
MKKYMKRIVLILMTFWANGLVVGEIPLKQAIETGIRTDSQYKNHLLEHDISRLNQAKARMKKLFQLDFGGSYLFKSQQMEILFPDAHPAPGVVIPGSKITAGAKHNYDLKLSLVQPIFTGGVLANAVKLETQKEILTKHQTTLREIEVAAKIKYSYFTYRLLENKKKSLSLLIKNLKLHLKKITDFYREDLVKKSDLLETEMNLSETEMKLEDLNQLLEEEKINFARLCTFNIEDIEKIYDETNGTFRESLEFFKAHHPVLKTIDNNIQSLFLGKKITSGRYLPQVNGFAELHYGKPGIDFFKNEWSLYFQGGIAVNFKIFDWNQLRKDKKIVDFSIQQLNNRKEELITETKKTLAQMYAKKRTIEKQLELLEKLVTAAAQDAALKEELYKEHQVANIDYLASLLTKERYQSMKNERAVEYQLVKLSINTLIGRYGEEK